MILKLQILLISVSLLFCILIFDMLRKKMIQLKYSLLWIITSFFLLLISIFPMIIEKIASLIGVIEGENAIFYFSIFFLVIIIFSLSFAISRNSLRISKLSQEIALLKGLENKNRSKGNKIN